MRILLGLVAGVGVGLALGALWTDAVWHWLGVHDPTSLLAGGGRAADAANPGGLNATAGPLSSVVAFIVRANQLVGDVFLKGLRFVAVPIVLFSLAAGIADLGDVRKLGRIGGRTIGLYILTTVVAITVGLLLANLLGPGRGFPESRRLELVAANQAATDARVLDATEQADRSGWDLLLDIVPENPFQSLAHGNTLQVVVLAVLLGCALLAVPRSRSAPLLALFRGLTDVTIKIVEMFLALAPFAVFSLMAPVVASLGASVLVSLLAYVATVLLGLALLTFGVYPALIRIFTPLRYGRFTEAVSPAQLLAFSSASSGAALPVTMECVEKRLGVSSDVTSFVIPIGATINMDGTALYQGVAAVFIAQIFGMDLSLTDQLTIVLSATLASVGTAAVPGVGMVMLVVVLESVGLPLEGIAIIQGVDRLLDMCRTACNVTGDCAVAAAIASFEGELDPPEVMPDLAVTTMESDEAS